MVFIHEYPHAYIVPEGLENMALTLHVRLEQSRRVTYVNTYMHAHKSHVWEYGHSSALGVHEAVADCEPHARAHACVYVYQHVNHVCIVVVTSVLVLVHIACICK